MQVGLQSILKPEKGGVFMDEIGVNVTVVKNALNEIRYGQARLKSIQQDISRGISFRNGSQIAEKDRLQLLKEVTGAVSLLVQARQNCRAEVKRLEGLSATENSALPDQQGVKKVIDDLKALTSILPNAIEQPGDGEHQDFQYVTKLLNICDQAFQQARQYEPKDTP